MHMPVSGEEANRRVLRLSEALRSSGFRLTHQRLEVVREIASTDAHPDADLVFERVRERVPTMSLDTVYRTLGTLADLGLVNRVSGVTNAARYDANTDKHHHFICGRCGCITDIKSSDIDATAIPSTAEGIGRIDSMEVYFRGVCRECGP
jgi:Fur family transcriptional regulator, peroxide stress response regulator